LGLLGGGIIIACSSRDVFEAQQATKPTPVDEEPPEGFNAFLRIGEDGRVTCLTGKVELGQGAITALAQLLADELDVSLDSVDMVMGDTDLCPYDMGTFGSMTIRIFGPILRAAAAEARAVLVELAAERLGLPPERLATRDGAVQDTQSEATKVSYAELTRGKTIARRLEREAVLESVADFTIVGRPVFHADAVEKVTGKAEFAGDIRLPGMLYARLLRPHSHDVTLKSVDASKAKEVEGAIVVEQDDLVAVLHENPEDAGRALRRIKAQFDGQAGDVNQDTIFEHLLANAPEGGVVASGGDLEEGAKLASSTVELTYYDGYVAHAPIETHTALARVEDGKATVWASTQAPFRIKSQVAEALDFGADDVRVITPFVGGGYGGKSSGGQAIEAARLAKITGKPVQVAWTRAEELFYDTYRPAAVVKIKAGINKAGRITHWDYGVYFAGKRGSEQFYAIPHHRTVAYGSGWRGDPGPHPIRTGAWRAPANNTNTFARESHIDALAVAAGRDPVEFRLDNLEDPRMRRVLEAAAKKFGWTPAKSPSGRGYGVACGIDVGTYVAHIAEVEVDRKSGAVKVKRVVCAQDMGLAVNPQGATVQVEGCITMGLGYALTEEIRFKGGEIFDTNFDTYEIPRFSWVPKIECVLIDAKESPPAGGGEPAIVCMGAVVANAIHDAVGARVMRLPMTPARVKAALSA